MTNPRHLIAKCRRIPAWKRRVISDYRRRKLQNLRRAIGRSYELLIHRGLR